MEKCVCVCVYVCVYAACVYVCEREEGGEWGTYSYRGIAAEVKNRWGAVKFHVQRKSPSKGLHDLQTLSRGLFDRFWYLSTQHRNAANTCHSETYVMGVRMFINVNDAKVVVASVETKRSTASSRSCARLRSICRYNAETCLE